jgi:hypothetical protein
MALAWIPYTSGGNNSSASVNTLNGGGCRRGGASAQVPKKAECLMLVTVEHPMTARGHCLTAYREAIGAVVLFPSGCADTVAKAAIVPNV